MSKTTKNQRLGLSYGTARGRLHKLIMWSLAQETGRDVCFQCGQRIESVDDLSVEHKAPWQSAPDPVSAFFDLKNIAFSHLRCNVLAADRSGNGSRRDQCPIGHPLSDENVYIDPKGRRECRACKQVRTQRYQTSTHGKERRQAYFRVYNQTRRAGVGA